MVSHGSSGTTSYCEFFTRNSTVGKVGIRIHIGLMDTSGDLRKQTKREDEVSVGLTTEGWLGDEDEWGR